MTVQDMAALSTAGEAPAEDLTSARKRELEEIMYNCSQSTKCTAATFFPDRFFREFDVGHEPIFDALDDDSIRKLVIAAPRSIGKTSIVHVAYLAKRILFRQSPYIMAISASEGVAEEHTDDLKEELEQNPLMRQLFPPLKTKTWSTARWDTSLGTRVRPRGAGQQIRGLLYRGRRPKDIVIDDLEDDVAVKSEIRRHDLKQWFDKAVQNGVDLGADDWRIIVCGTILHEDGLLSNLLEDTDWEHIRLELCDDDLNSLWPAFRPTAWVKERYEYHRQKGTLGTFYMEYRNLPIAKEDAAFNDSMFRYYDETDSRFVEDTRTRKIETVILVDPGKTVGPLANPSAVIGLGIDTRANGLYVRDVVTRRMPPDQLYDEVFAMADRLGAFTIGLEVTSLNEFILHPFKNEMLRRNKAFELVELKARAKKEERIAALIPFYRQGLVHHNMSCCAPLEAQLLSFPRSKYDDAMDALAYGIELMELGSRYFEPIDQEEDLDAIEQEYDSLDNESALSSWGVL